MFGRSLVLSLLVLLVACGKGTTTPPDTMRDSGPGPEPEVCLDGDGDGVPGTGDCDSQPQVDCDDANATIKPGATETCDGIDQDCDGQIDEGLPTQKYWRDVDGDGVGSLTQSGEGCLPPPSGSVLVSNDCDDSNPQVKPGATEVCNGVDDDCDGVKDQGLSFQDFFVDADGDGSGDARGAPLNSCQPMVAGRVANKGDCDDANPTVKPGALELCNKADDNCDGQVDNGVTFLDYYPDVDGDGFGSAGAAPENSCSTVAGKVTNHTDCNDSSAQVKPGAPETCNAVDDDCDGQIDEGLQFSNYYPDQDGDGAGQAGAVAQSSCAVVPGKVTNATDCNDMNAQVKPGAPEVCNAVDDNCNGTKDEGLTFVGYYVDADGDGYGSGAVLNACSPVAGRVTNNQDCNDANPQVKPGAAEVCNGIDDNCTGGVDEGLQFSTYYPDQDGDGFGNASATGQSSCTPVTGRVTNNQDCDDALFAVKPGAAETCNGRDDNCNAQTDEGLSFLSYYPDLDQDGYGAAGSTAQSSCAPVPGKVTNNQDCNDAVSTVRPMAPETCNGVDDNCDGQVDNGTVTQSYYVDMDGDGFGAATSSAIVSCAPVSGRVANNLDCNDGASAIRPNATEVCNGIDDDCDGTPDDGLTFLSYYPDLDGDGFGASGATAQSSCTPVGGKVTNATDCNDGAVAIRPGATEVCNGIDDNCTGGVDEGLPTQSYWLDADGDGFGASGSQAVQSCGPVNGRVPNATDCNDQAFAVKPTATEVCNGADDDCDQQTDEGNPGGGGSCSTGQAGVCAAGTYVCESGAVACLRNVTPSAERCNALDDDCNGQVDETFTNRGQSCSAGLGACARTGTYVCSASETTTECSVVAGPPTAAACDGVDNDCDGVVDEPALTATVDLQTALAASDIEVEPFFHSDAGCAGGVTGTGSDGLAGGALALAGPDGGFYFQRLDTAGVPSGVPVAAASSLKYADVDLAQAGDGFMLVGIYRGTGNVPIELDFNYHDAFTGARRAILWSQFDTGNALDSLRVLRGNGKRVTVVWREQGVGYKLVRVEPCFDGTTWTIRGPGCGAVPTPTLLAGTATFPPGLGADSMHVDWEPTQTCVAASTLRKHVLAWLTSPTSVTTFSLNEDGTGKSTETSVYSVSSPRVLAEPDAVYFRNAGADATLVSYVTKDSGASPANADLDFWVSTSPGWRYAFLSYATQNGVDSIIRPRGSATGSRLWLSGVRYVNDTTGFKRQVMTRQTDLLGVKVPAATTVEIATTTGGCGTDADCRAGDKLGFVPFAPFGRVYGSATGATPTGSFSSVLTCQ